MSDDLNVFRDEVRAFIAAKLPVAIRERLRQGHLPSKDDTVTWQRILAERGWSAPHWPREYGGAGVSAKRPSDGMPLTMRPAPGSWR